MSDKITLQAFVDSQVINNEGDLLAISEQIMAFGGIDAIVAELDDQALNAFIMMNIIGAWKGDGWCGVLENYEFLPFVESTLKVFQLNVMADHWHQLVNLFPMDPFKPSVQEHFYDHLNFLSNPRFKLKTPTLQSIDTDVRQSLSSQYQKLLGVLDEEAEKLWSYNAPNQQGWGAVIDYIHKYSNQ